MDKGRELADKELLKLERSLSKEYATAKKEMKAKYNEFTRKVDKKDEEKRALLAKGAITKTDYDEWRANQTYRAKWFKDMIRTLAKDQTAVNKRAAAIINGTTSGVYAEQFNYGTYMVEKAAKVDTAFTLYDKGAVRNLNAKAEIKVTKDIAWNNRKINSALMQGILQGESIPDIANRLAKIPDMNAGAAVRNARTLMTSAENEGRLDSFERAANMGINLKKTWVATIDDRVRESHAELDGETVPIDEPFSNGLMYPADPSGDDPAQVYNCRCTMITQIDGFERDVTDLDIRPAKIGSYEEWKAAHAGKPAEEGFFADRIKRIMAEKGTSEEAVYECGKVFADEMERSYFKPMRDELDDAERAFNEMSDKLSKYTQEQSDINEELMNHYLGNKVLPEKVEIELFERAEKLGKKIGAIINSNKYTEAEKRLDKAKDALSVHNYKKHADMLAEKLKNIREVGSDGLDIKSHLNNSRSPVRKFVEFAYSKYPTDWVKDSVSTSKLKIGKVNRGYYWHAGNQLMISHWSDQQATSTAFHELGHRYEYIRSGIKSAEKSFYKRRTEGEALEWMGTGYKRDEKTRKDKFLNKYMGKDYGGTAYELVSMGFQYAYTDPLLLAKDPDMQKWIYGLLCTM